jgi:hypothetical protein
MLICMAQAGREAALPDSRCSECRRIDPEVGSGRRVDDERAGIADIGQMREQLKRLDKAASSRPIAVQVEAEHRAAPVRQKAAREQVVGVSVEFWPPDARDFRP